MQTLVYINLSLSNSLKKAKELKKKRHFAVFPTSQLQNVHKKSLTGVSKQQSTHIKAQK